MCTLTYFLTDDGYELFFNRDEQRSRPLAQSPVLNKEIGAIFPVDPQGMGTWICVHNSGLSLALLNLYQVQAPSENSANLSRGQLILSLLKKPDAVDEQLAAMDLTVYQPFQLCVFPPDLAQLKPGIKNYLWDGRTLIEENTVLPITSSGVEFEAVLKKRQTCFNDLVDLHKPERKHFMAYHRSQENEGKYSVNMQRPDARTVSISHITVGQDIAFIYYDMVVGTEQTSRCRRQAI